MGRLFIAFCIAALLFGGTHSEGAALHGYHIKTHTIHAEGLIHIEGKAEAEDVVAIARRVAVTIRRATEPIVVEPATATNNPVRPTPRACRISLSIATIAAIPVLTPFQHIAAHVIQAQLIRLLFLYGMCLTSTVNSAPGYIVYHAATAILGVIAPVATSGGILPLCFCRQAESFTC